MKKLLAMILALVMALSLVACGSKDNGQQQGGDVSGDKVIKVGVFEPTSGQNAGGGKKGSAAPRKTDVSGDTHRGKRRA